MCLLRVKNVKKDYRLGNTFVKALNGVSLTIDKEEFLSIIGPSGSGKTTLLNLIGCLDIPSAGEIILDGKDIKTLTENQRADVRLYKIGFIFQSFNLIPVLNVYENIEFPLLLEKEKINKKARHELITSLVEEVGLANHVKHRPAELSGGQRQRVAIARALVTNPKIVLADEPTANLDSKTGLSIIELMRTINQEEKTTFIFSTHDPEILQFARRIVHIKDGVIEDDNTIYKKAI